MSTSKLNRDVQFLVENYKDDWYKIYTKEFRKLDEECSMFCVCGKLATGFHVDRCTKFRNEVYRRTVAQLKSELKVISSES